MESPCSRCGCNRPFHDQIEKAMERNWKVSQDYKRTAAAHAIAIAERDLQIMDLRAEQQWLQKKVKKQAEHLRKLEAKLIKLGMHPYEKEAEE